MARNLNNKRCLCFLKFSMSQTFRKALSVDHLGYIGEDPCDICDTIGKDMHWFRRHRLMLCAKCYFDVSNCSECWRKLVEVENAKKCNFLKLRESANFAVLSHHSK